MLIVLCVFCSVAKVAWGAFKFLFILVAFVALLNGCNHPRHDADLSPASYGRY
jgi:hypothetical protein